MKLALNFVLIAFFTLLCVGCKPDIGSEVPLPPNLNIPKSMLNKDLRVTAPAVWNDFKKEEDFIDLDINLVTDKQIVTAPDFNAEIYIYDDIENKWIKIKNLTNYDTPPDEIYMQQGDIKGFAVFPDLSQITESQNKLLILVSGNVIENGQRTDKIVGTYIIINLLP